MNRARRHPALLLGLAGFALAWAVLPSLASGSPARECNDSSCADVSVSGHAEPQPIRRNETTELKITPKNDGPGTTYGIKVAVDIPSELKVKSTRISGDGNDRGCSNNGYGFVECYPGDFSDQELAVVRIKVKAKQKGTFVSQVRVYSSGTNDPNGGNNQVGITVGVKGKRDG